MKILTNNLNELMIISMTSNTRLRIIIITIVQRHLFQTKSCLQFVYIFSLFISFLTDTDVDQ